MIQPVVAGIFVPSELVSFSPVSRVWSSVWS